MAPVGISIRDVSFRYLHGGAEVGRLALAGIDLEVSAGEFVGVVGANGSGKSTLARLLNGLLLPTAGEVAVEGFSTTEAGNLNRIRETVGIVFQNPDSQIVATSVEDDIAFGPENLGLPAAEIERRVDRVCRQLGIEALRGSQPHWLSGGQKQLVVLAGVLALEPKILVLDEPTSMLDPRSQRRFRDLIGGLWEQGTTVVYITQIMEEIATAPRVLALAGGGIAFDGPPEDLFSRPGLMQATGMLPPLAARLADALNARGFAIPTAMTLPDLVNSACGSS